jgi:hypothetical protein
LRLCVEIQVSTCVPDSQREDYIKPHVALARTQIASMRAMLARPIIRVRMEVLA